MTVRQFLIGVGTASTIIVTGVVLVNLVRPYFGDEPQTLFCTSDAVDLMAILNRLDSTHVEAFLDGQVTVFVKDSFTCSNVLGEGWENVFEK